MLRIESRKAGLDVQWAFGRCPSSTAAVLHAAPQHAHWQMQGRRVVVSDTTEPMSTRSLARLSVRTFAALQAPPASQPTSPMVEAEVELDPSEAAPQRPAAVIVRTPGSTASTTSTPSTPLYAEGVAGVLLVADVLPRASGFVSAEVGIAFAERRWRTGAVFSTRLSPSSTHLPAPDLQVATLHVDMMWALRREVALGGEWSFVGGGAFGLGVTALDATLRHTTRQAKIYAPLLAVAVDTTLRHRPAPHVYVDVGVPLRGHLSLHEPYLGRRRLQSTVLLAVGLTLSMGGQF